MQPCNVDALVLLRKAYYRMSGVGCFDRTACWPRSLGRVLDARILLLMSLLVMQSRLGEKLLEICVVCPPNGTAVPEGLISYQVRTSAILLYTYTVSICYFLYISTGRLSLSMRYATHCGALRGAVRPSYDARTTMEYRTTIV